jgi:hypothetical protein
MDEVLNHFQRLIANTLMLSGSEKQRRVLKPLGNAGNQAGAKRTARI